MKSTNRKVEVNELINWGGVVRPKSMIITILGDLIIPLGGEIWAGHLVSLMEWFGITKFSSRICVQRLEEEGWLKKIKKNSYSFYAFSDTAMKAYRFNYPKIYSLPVDNWQGEWQIALLQETESEIDIRFLKTLNWFGFRKIYKNVYIYPSHDREGVVKLFKNNNMDEVIFLYGSMDDLKKGNLINEFTKDMWDVDAYNDLCDQFINSFSRITPTVIKEAKNDPELALFLRLKLIHEYRRIILKSHFLPRKLLERNINAELFRFCAKFYHELFETSEQYMLGLKKNNYFKQKNDVLETRFNEKIMEGKVNRVNLGEVTELPTKKLKSFAK